MIIKHINRAGQSSPRNLIRYVLRYVTDKTAQHKTSKQPFVYSHNLKSRDVEGYIKEFRETAKGRIDKRKTASAIRHIVLSWKKEDASKISHDMLREIAKQYITLRGGNNSQYLFVQHQDRLHAHIHICESTCTIAGKSNRMSKAVFAQLKLDMDAFQKARFPVLVSLPYHGRLKETKEKPAKQWHKSRMTQKEALIKTLDAVYTRAISIEDFADRLKAKELEPYYRGKGRKLSGIIATGSRRFRLKTLGFDEQKLAKLDLIRTKELKELGELKRIRARAKERECERGFERERHFSM
jgi:hypothetical protein